MMGDTQDQLWGSQAFYPKRCNIQESPGKLQCFFQLPPLICQGFAKTIEDRKRYAIDRKLLQSVLYKHYDGHEMSELQTQHLTALSEENTFTVVTAHQPSLLTGPLYYILQNIFCHQFGRTIKVSFPFISFLYPFSSLAVKTMILKKSIIYTFPNVKL